MARTYVFLCVLALTFIFLVCEIVVGQLCKSLLILVDSFHTLYVSVQMILSTFKNPPKTSVTNPYIPSASFPEPCTHTTPGPSHPSISLPPNVASGIMDRTGPLGDEKHYSRMRLKPLGTLISAILLSSQCVSISLEILTHLVQPEPIQHPFLSIVVGAASLLFNILVLTWRNRNRGMGKAADDINNCPELTETGPPSTSKDKEGTLQEDALMFCNPEANSVLDADQNTQDCSSSCQELPTPHITTHDPGLSHTQNSNSSIYERHQEVLQPPKQLPKEVTSMDLTVSQIAQCTPKGSRFGKLQTGCIRGLISIIQDLLCSVLILVNALLLLLFHPHCHRHHSDCHLLVYLDAIFSIVVVLVLLATALPKLYLYGMLVLQATPFHLSISDMRLSLTRVPGVLSVHELHVWQLSEACMVASVHVHCTGGLKATECSDLMAKIRGVLSTFGINHCTVQPEFLPPDHNDAASSAGIARALPEKPACSLSCGRECVEKLCCSPQVEGCQGLQEKSSCSLAPCSVDKVEDVIIENTYL